VEQIATFTLEREQKELFNDMQNAKKYIKIVSPNLSPFLIEELIKFRKRKLVVPLITIDNIEYF
jgi:hypothetical protein